MMALPQMGPANAWPEEKAGMQNLAIGLVLGIILGVGASGLVAQRGPGIYPDAVTADPKHYSVSFENDVVRFIRAKYGPGEKSVMHRHLPGCVVFLTDQTFNFTLPDGTTEPASVPARALGCSDGNVHLPENIGAEAEFIMVEFKDRATFQR
jgi:hypothetical protein